MLWGHRARLREKDNLFSNELSLWEISYVLYVQALMGAR